MSPFVCLLPEIRPSCPLWARSSLYCSLKNAAFVGGGEGSSVGVFRLGVLRYNHMTVGKKPAKNSRCKKSVEGGRQFVNVNFAHWL